MTAFGVAVKLKSNGVTIVMRPILFPGEACSVNQILPELSMATEFGPEVVVGTGYSEN